MDVFEAIADPVRRRLLEQLSGGSARVVDLAAVHPISRPAISRHLRILGDAGLVRCSPQGRERHYMLEPAPLRAVHELLQVLGGASSHRPPISDQHLDALATEVSRTSRDRRRTSTTSTTSTDHRPPTKEYIA